MDQATTDGLHRVLINKLNPDLTTSLNLETLLSKGYGTTKETAHHLVFIRAIHLKRTIPHLRRMGYEVTDVTSPRQVVSAASIGEAIWQLKGNEVPGNVVVVTGIFCNGSFRWGTGRWNIG
jgi:hypothetical protein